MTAPNLGNKPNSDLRDAVHVPVIPMTASERLMPGDKVELVKLEMDEEEDFYYNGPGATARKAVGEWDGIVDPYLDAPVEKDGVFWMFMRKIDGQPRHDWDHPKLTSTHDIAFKGGMNEGQCCYGGG